MRRAYSASSRALAALLILGSGSAWTARRAPANDAFAARIALSGNSAAVTGTNVGASSEPGEPLDTPNAGSHSVWWSWTAPVTGDVTIDTNGSAFDTVMGVYTGSSVSALTRVAGDDDGGTGTASLVAFFAVAGTDYKISVDGYGGATGAISLNLVNLPSQIAYQTNFDAGASGWTLDAPVAGSAWAADATPASFPSGVSRGSLSLNFNNGTDYAGGTSGGALSPLIPLAGITNPILEFWCNYSTETRGTQYDRRTLEILDSKLTTKLAEWQLASVGYSFNPAGGIVGIGPGPCGEAYVDLETGAPVTAWHTHRIHLDPAWGSIHVRFVFWSVDDRRNNYAGWAIDDLVVRNHPTPPPTGWPDNMPDTDTQGLAGFELDKCSRTGNLLKWSWGCTNQGDAGVHMIIGNHPQSILDDSFMFFDVNHGHYHMSQYSDFSLWQAQAFGFQKVRRGPKRSFCLTDIHEVVAGSPSLSPGCGGAYQLISYGWQDVYALGTQGQEIDVTGLASGDYTLVGVIDPLNRLRETNNLNQTDQIHFTLPAGDLAQVAILDRSNPYPPTAMALTISSVAAGTFQGSPALHLFGTGFDTTLVPVLYDTGTTVSEAPFFTIISATEIWVTLPPGLGPIASVDLLRPSGDAASIRLAGPAPVPAPPPADAVAGPLGVSVPGGLIFSGAAGGPFAPSLLTLTLQNQGTAPLSWEALKHDAWVLLSSSTGVIAPGGAAMVDVSIAPAAAGLAPGSYADPVFLVNRTNGTGSTMRPVVLNLTGPAPQMKVTPSASFLSIGIAGGPFAPASAATLIENKGPAPLDWTAAWTQSWLSLSPPGGTLAAGATVSVTATLAAGAGSLAVGRFADTITFTNATNGNGSTFRGVSLDVVATAPPTLGVTPPPATVTSTPLAVGGGAVGSNLTGVAWSNGATGGSGAATGLFPWSASIGLAAGPNEITITAFDESGNGSSRTFVVDAALPASPSGGGGRGCGATGLAVLLALLRRRRR
ncbi:MAG: hypothetical protein HY293_03705 [Planctomycetes bacterium]|nr:hypothetical protein [Planctomycetota bacterium]